MLSLILANRGMTLSQTRERYFEWTLLGLILILGMILFYEALPFLNGALGAITLYLLLRRTNIYLSRRFSPRAAPWIITLTVTLFVLLPLSALTWYVIDMVQNVNIDLQAIIKRFTNTLNYLEQVTHYDLMSEKTVAFITAKATGVMNMLMSGINNTAINLFTAILLLFFLLSGGMKMERAIARCLPFNDTNKRAITSKISTIVRSNAIGIPLLALIQGVVATVGYSFCDVKNPIEFGALTGFASMIPIVGSMLVWVPLAVMQYFEQGLLSAVYVGAYGALIISQCDNVLRMILQKRMANTHPLITIFGVIAGLPLFGFMGLIFGPLMVAMFLLFLEMFVSQYIIGTDISPVSNRHTPSMRALMPNKKQGSKVNKTTLDSSKAKAVTARGLDTKGLDSAPTRAYKGNSPQAEQMAVQALLQRGKTQAQNRAAMRQTSRATKVATKEATKVATKANAGSAIKDSDTTKTVTQAKAQTETAVTAKAATASATTNKNDARKSTTAITKDKANAGESSAQSQSAAQPTAQLATQALSQPQAQPEKQAAVPASELQQGPEPSTTVAAARPELKLSNAKAKAKTKNDFKSALLPLSKVTAFIKDPKSLSLMLLQVIPYSAIGIGFFNFFLPVTVQENGMGASTVGQLNFLYSFLVIILAPIMGKVIDKIDRKYVILSLALLFSALVPLAFKLPSLIGASILAMILLGISASINEGGQPAVMASYEISKKIGPSVSIKVLDSFLRLGQIAGPLIIAVIMSAFGTAGFSFMAITVAVCAMLFFIIQHFLNIRKTSC